MDFKGLVCLLVLYVAQSNGASIPESGLDYHFNQLGVNFGLKLDDKAVPLKGGKIYAEFPVHTIFSLIKGEPTLFKKMFIPFKEELYMFYNPGMFERLRDVLTLKAVITYKGEHVNSGIFDTKIEYTFVHPDYTEETGTIHAEGQTVFCSGYCFRELVLALDIVSENAIVLPKFVLHPFKIEASFKPNTEFKVVYTASHTTFDMTLFKEGQTFKLHTIYKHLEHEQTYDVEINVADKKIIFAHKEDGTEMTHLEFIIQGNIMNLKMVQMKGKLQATRWFEAGPVESTFIVKGKDYEFNVVFNNNEMMKSKMNVQGHFLKAKMNFEFLEEYKGTVYMDYDRSAHLFEIKFPKEWFADMKTFGIVFNLKPISVGHPFFGGVYTATILREDVPFFKFDLDYNFIMDVGKYELVFNHVHVETLNAELVDTFFYMLPITKYNFCHKYLINGCFGKGEFQGKIFFDRVNKNDIFNKFTITGKVIKMEAEVFEVVIDTVPTPYHFSVFYPRVFQRMFNKPMERLTLDVDHVAAGPEHALTFTTNYEDMVVKFERNSHHMSAKIMKHAITFVEFTQEHQLVYNANEFFLTMKPTLHFHDDSFIHKELCHFSSYTCFTELVGDVHVVVVAKSKNKVDLKITVNKDTKEIYHLEATNKQTPYKFVFKSPYVVPFFKYMRGQTWFTWMMPVLKSPFDITVEFHPVEKKLVLNTNIDTQENMIQVVPLGDDKFNVEFNHEVVAEFVTADKKVEFLRTLKDGTTLKTIVTWTGGDIFENTATATVMYKDVPQVVTIGWNVRDLAHGTVMVDVVVKKAPMFGDVEFHRNVKWNVINAHEFEMTWDGKSAANMMKALATPIMTDAKINFNKMDVQVKIQKKLNAKTFTMMFNTHPFKFALLPFFEI